MARSFARVCAVALASAALTGFASGYLAALESAAAVTPSIATDQDDVLAPQAAPAAAQPVPPQVRVRVDVGAVPPVTNPLGARSSSAPTTQTRPGARGVRVTATARPSARVTPPAVEPSPPAPSATPAPVAQPTTTPSPTAPPPSEDPAPAPTPTPTATPTHPTA